MRHTLLALVVFAGFALGLTAQERISLTTPIPQPAQVVGYTVSALLLKWEPTPQIVVTLRGEDGKYTDQVYEGATATTLMTALNKANLSTRSLNQRIFDRLIADGRIAGTVAGSVP
jgi:hypothetical protein